ncbi:MAG: DNA translocase FtsK [Oscillospiraceae bacterium]|nr:DNA translocase FtsK [Oscillospiraceae bacterium]
MAQSNRKKSTSTSKTNAPAKKSASKTTSKKNQNPSKTPYRREIMAAVCFILAAFSFISYFNTDGAFIGLFAGLVKGLVGNGFFFLAPALLLCSIILTFHRGRPVAFRVTCALLLCLMAGALSHLFSRAPEYGFELSFSMFPALWTSGLQLRSGGAVSGALADLFGWLFGRVGATIVFIMATAFLLLTAINRSIVNIIDAIKKRPRVEYIPEPESEPTTVIQKYKPAGRGLSAISRRARGIDIPIDGDTKPEAPDFPDPPTKDPLFKKSPRVRTPDQLITEYDPNDAIKSDASGGNHLPYGDVNPDTPVDTPDTKADAILTSSAAVTGDNSVEDSTAEEIIDLPLDIPFMEGKRRSGNETKSSPSPTSPAKPAAVAPLLEPDVPDTSHTSSKESAPESALPESEKPEDAIKSELLESIQANGDDAAYIFPPIELLATGIQKAHSGDDEIKQNSERLETAFQSFGVNVKISNATRGPAVTRYEAAMEAGVKLSKLTNLADDIALSLGTSGVRIAAMPNMISTVGIEVPNKSVSVVYLRDIIESKEFTTAPSKLTFAIGKNISDESIVGNAAKMPHMLVAGTTGSGKSVCLNSIILSLLYKATPEEVRFIMIDPKMVEFNVYNDIPHLLVPVVTDVKKASGALQWAVFEMTKRYTLFKETNARDLAGYNKVARESEDEELKEFPQIVIIIDELADLMMTAAKEVEESICRVAQMGRAAGMHLIIATQSPRADVITGLMKANIPSRISFKVSSALESRIILDAGGNADKLVGNGDMLFAPIGSDKPMRVQGTWVSDAEREKVVAFIKSSGETQYSEEVMGEIEKAAVDKSSSDRSKDEVSGNGSDHDELLPQAVDVIFETGQASVSMLQRRLKLGYSRAARIVDQMEQMGIVGPFEGSKPRALLITKEQWRQMQYVNGTAPEDSIFDQVMDMDDVEEQEEEI